MVATPAWGDSKVHIDWRRKLVCMRELITQLHQILTGTLVGTEAKWIGK